MDILGRNATALRLPALAGFLLPGLPTSSSITGSRALVPRSSPWRYRSSPPASAISTEGRPSGLLLGMYALSILCWQIAAFDDGVPRNRLLPLTGLALSITLAIASHYTAS